MATTESKIEMPQAIGSKATNGLHLPDLVVRGFRGLNNLEISNLGRVTMITGKNSIGKSSVLDAVKIYAAGGSYTSLTSLLAGREEFTDTVDEDGDHANGIDLSGLFFDWNIADSDRIVIGSTDSDNQLTIEVKDVTEEQLELFVRMNPNTYTLGDKMLSASIDGSSYDLPWVFSFDDSAAPMSYRIGRRYAQMHRQLVQQQSLREIPCMTFGPGLPNNNELATIWDKVTLTPAEDVALRALRIVLGEGVDRIAVVSDPFVSDSFRPTYGGSRRIVVGRRGYGRQFPIKAFGDGAFRALGIALALTRSGGGFLLIDEAENGIHYSIQSEFWRMVLQTAYENDIQVIATTHSSDCVRGFAQAALENDAVDGRLVQLSRRDGSLRAAELPEPELVIAAEQGIEVR